MHTSSPAALPLPLTCAWHALPPQIRLKRHPIWPRNHILCCGQNFRWRWVSVWPSNHPRYTNIADNASINFRTFAKYASLFMIAAATAAGAPQQGNIIRPEGHASYPARSWSVPIPGIMGGMNVGLKKTLRAINYIPVHNHISRWAERTFGPHLAAIRDIITRFPAYHIVIC